MVGRKRNADQVGSIVAALKSWLDKGATLKLAAEKIGVSYKMATYYRHLHNLSFVSQRGKHMRNMERDAEMVKRRNCGATFEDLARDFAITRQGAHDACKRWHVRQEAKAMLAKGGGE